MNDRNCRSSGCTDSAVGAYICYLRETGEKMAWIVYYHLRLKNVRAYLDLNERARGRKEKRMDRAIREHPSFVLILNHRRCATMLKGKTPFRKRVDQAVKTDRDIIPFVLEDLDLSRIPKKVAKELRAWEEVEYGVEDFDHALDTLVRMVSYQEEEDQLAVELWPDQLLKGQ